MGTDTLEQPVTLTEASRRQAIERHEILCRMVENYVSGKVDGEHVAHVLRDVLHKSPADFEAAVAKYHRRKALAQTLDDAADPQTQIDKAQAELDELYAEQQRQTLEMRAKITNKLAERNSLVDKRNHAKEVRNELASVSDLGRALVESRRAAQRDEIERALMMETDPQRRGELQERLDSVDTEIAADLLAPGIL